MSPAEIKKKCLDILKDIAPDEDLSQLNDERVSASSSSSTAWTSSTLSWNCGKAPSHPYSGDDYINLASMNSTVAYLEPLMRDMQREKV